ncbi:MAG: tRNA (guanosine(46)-N7)-methyltransferase TrmB [Buchananella hordeovulneris]|nr:tRNA (guanosine(46)-N7)-methyltransferase TrmB [Buchananella hordeovulneris]
MAVFDANSLDDVPASRLDSAACARSDAPGADDVAATGGGGEEVAAGGNVGQESAQELAPAEFVAAFPQVAGVDMPGLDGRLPSRVASFARRSGRLPERGQRLWEEAHGDVVVDVKRGPGMTTVALDYQLDVEALFGRSAPLLVEVGCGNGEALVAHAKANPHINHLAFEVWRPGVVGVLRGVKEAGVTNVRVVEADAAQALPVLLTPASVSELWTFFPDPWRKARHHKRRLVSPAYAQTVANLLVDGGIWRLATDWESYAEQMGEVLRGATDVFETTGQPGERFAGRVLTRFEQKGIDAGRQIADFTATRRTR